MRSLAHRQAVSGEDASALAVWEEWGRITRFLQSARVAFARERDLWTSLGIVSADNVRFKGSSGKGAYRVGISDHLAAVADEDVLYASALIHSYAIAESAACDRLGADSRNAGGIEEWGAKLLGMNHESWESVTGGLAGAVEVAVVRNAYAHGFRRIDSAAAKRLRGVGLTQPREGDPVALDYPTLRVYRARLRDLLGAGGIRHGD